MREKEGGRGREGGRQADRQTGAQRIWTDTYGDNVRVKERERESETDKLKWETDTHRKHRVRNEASGFKKRTIEEPLFPFIQ